MKQDNWSTPTPLPHDLLPVKAFESSLLPKVFKDFAEDLSDRMQCPIEYAAVTLMTMLGGVVGKRCSIYPKAHDDWLVVPNLWGALVGRPSAMKSPPMTAAQAGVSLLTDKARSDYKDDLEKFIVQKIIYEAQLKSFKNRINKAVKDGVSIPSDMPEKPIEPIERRYLTNAGSVEKLIQIQSDNPNGIIQHRDELIGWMRSMDNPNSQDARSFYLEAWSGAGASFSYDTMAHGHLCLETGACVSVMGTIQPGLLAQVVTAAERGESGDDGLLQRFQLMVYPDKAMSWKYKDRKPNKVFSNAVKEVFKSAVDISGKARFDDKAQDIFIEWYSNLMLRVHQEQHLGMESHLSKYSQLMPALALLIHLAEFASRPESNNATRGTLTNISVDAAIKAVGWCTFLESHARRIYAMGKNSGVDAAKLLLKRSIEGKLAKPFTLRDAQRKGWKDLGDSKQIKNAVELLERYGWARLKTLPTGGRTSEVCYIHPNAEQHLVNSGTTVT